jgi:hypothetical protein
MKTTVSIYDFRQAFYDMDRGNQFSYDGFRVLFEALEEYEGSTGLEVELDVIALCCEYSEETFEEIASNYGYDLEGEDEDEQRDNLIDWLNERTFVCGYTKEGSIVYQSF